MFKSIKLGSYAIMFFSAFTIAQDASNVFAWALGVLWIVYALKVLQVISAVEDMIIAYNQSLKEQ
jgi:hypothetical protein